jgi:MraZ protein
VELEPKPTPVESPRGTYPARVDDKGRLKLPVNFQTYLASEKVFITSLDGLTARIYPISIWKENEKLFAEQHEDAETAEDISFLANQAGAEAEVDNQGRLLLPTDLRRDLNLENQPVWLDSFLGVVNVFNKEVYEERERRAKEGRAEKLKALKKKGLR